MYPYTVSFIFKEYRKTIHERAVAYINIDVAVQGKTPGNRTFTNMFNTVPKSDAPQHLNYHYDSVLPYTYEQRIQLSETIFEQNTIYFIDRLRQRK